MGWCKNSVVYVTISWQFWENMHQQNSMHYDSNQQKVFKKLNFKEYILLITR